MRISPRVTGPGRLGLMTGWLPIALVFAFVVVECLLPPPGRRE